MHNLSEETIKNASEGDIQAFESIYKSCSRYVYNVAWRITNKHEDAEEVVQEVFMVIYRRLKKFRFESSFKTWIYRITTNTAIDHVRKISSGKKNLARYREQLPISKPSKEIDSTINEEQQEETVNKILNHLTPDQKACMVLRNAEGLSYQEIAETLQININTVRSRIKRARETLLSKRKEVIKNEL